MLYELLKKCISEIKDKILSLTSSKQDSQTVYWKENLLVPFSQRVTFGRNIDGYEVAEIIFTNAKTGEKKEIVNHRAAIVNFPGVIEDKRWTDFLGENCFADKYVHYRTSIEDYDDEKYIIYWCIQPDGRYWEDEDGFGGTSDCEITLYTFIDKEGNFTGPFQVYNVGSKYFL